MAFTEWINPSYLDDNYLFAAIIATQNDKMAQAIDPQLDLQLRVKYADCTKFTPLTYLWTEGVHAGKFRVKFREPKPII